MKSWFEEISWCRPADILEKNGILFSVPRRGGISCPYPHKVSFSLKWWGCQNFQPLQKILKIKKVRFTWKNFRWIFFETFWEKNRKCHEKCSSRKIIEKSYGKSKKSKFWKNWFFRFSKWKCLNIFIFENIFCKCGFWKSKISHFFISQKKCRKIFHVSLTFLILNIFWSGWKFWHPHHL